MSRKVLTTLLPEMFIYNLLSATSLFGIFPHCNISSRISCPAVKCSKISLPNPTLHPFTVTSCPFFQIKFYCHRRFLYYLVPLGLISVRHNLCLTCYFWIFIYVILFLDPTWDELHREDPNPHPGATLSHIVILCRNRN